MKLKKNKINLIVSIVAIVLILLSSTFYVIKYINKNVLAGETSLQLQSGEITETNSVTTYSRLADVVEVGDYVAYDATNNYSYTSPKGNPQSHGNGYADQTFTSSSNIKWRVLSKNTSTGEVILTSEYVIIPNNKNTIFDMSMAMGYLYAEQELHSICSIYGHGKGANTNIETTYTVGGPKDTPTTGKITGTGARSIKIEDLGELIYGRGYHSNNVNYGDIIGTNTAGYRYPTMNTTDNNAMSTRRDVNFKNTYIRINISDSVRNVFKKYNYTNGNSSFYDREPKSYVASRFTDGSDDEVHWGVYVIGTEMYNSKTIYSTIRDGGRKLRISEWHIRWSTSNSIFTIRPKNDRKR